MKKLLLAAALLLANLNINAQNCSNTSVGYPPINDLGTGYWQGAQGGLYPNGSNYRPVFHNQQGLMIASQVQPLDTAGNVDLINGKIIWLSIGMSNTTGETQMFIPMADALQHKNPKLDLIDGAQSGKHIGLIVNPNNNFWQTVNNRLAAAGYTPKQVQVVWFKQAEGQPTDTSFATYPDALKIKFRIVMQIIKTKFQNTKLCYLSNRIYAGYATTNLNPEPFAYYTGWAIKRLIEDQINGDTALSYSGANIRSPWLSWGSNLWADGIIPNLDGLTWICLNDFNSDGTHPANPGRIKVANRLLSFFTTDSTAIPWFLNYTTSGIINDINSAQPIKIYPNPAQNIFSVELPDIFFEINITDVTGKSIFEEKNVFGKAQIDCKNCPNGIYSIRVTSNKHEIWNRKIIIIKI